MAAPNSQIAKLVSALRDVEGALAEVHVLIARREERGEALAHRVVEMHAVIGGMIREIQRNSEVLAVQRHGMERLDHAVATLHDDVHKLQLTYAKLQRLDGQDGKISADLSALQRDVQSLTTDVNRVLEALKLDNEPGLMAKVRSNSDVLTQIAAVGAAIVIVVGTLLGLSKLLSL